MKPFPTQWNGADVDTCVTNGDLDATLARNAADNTSAILSDKNVGT